MPIPLRTDYDASALRSCAKKTKDGPQARRHCHVWTAPADQGLFLALRRSWVRSCLRPFARRIESAGPDVVR